MTEAIKINANDGKTRNVMTGGETEIDFDFPIYAATHVTVYETDTAGAITLLVKDTDYSVPAGSVNQQAGGTIDLDGTQYPSGATAGHVFTVYQNAPQSRVTDFTQAGDFFADTLNQELDLITQQIQQLGRDLARAALAPVDTTLTSLSIPDPADGFALVWDGTAGAIRNSTASLANLEGDAETVADNIGSINTVAADLDGSDTIGTVAGAIANVNTVGAAIANVNIVASNISNVNTVAGISANVTTVATDSADIQTVAANIVDVNSFAAIYRIASSDPATSLDEGDLVYNTSENALKYYNGSSWQTIAPGISNVIEDTTPQLGGNLDVNGNSIVSASNGDIAITPNGTGKIVLDGLNWPTADGTADQILKTDGAGQLAFGDAGGGMGELLGSYTASNVTSVDIGSGLDLDAALDGTYDIYKLFYVDVVPANNAVALYGRTSTDTGTTFATTSYENNNITITNNSNTVGVQTETGNVALELASNVGSSTAESISGELTIFNPSDTVNYKKFLHESNQWQASTSQYRAGAVYRKETAAIDALRLLFSSGNIESGDFYLYGIKKA